LKELVDEFPARIEFLLVGVGVDGLLVLREQHAAFDLHQRRRHDEELAGDLELQVLHRVEDLEVLLGHRLDRDVVDIEFVFAQQEQQQVQRTFEHGEFDAIIGFGDHGPSRGSARQTRKGKSRRERTSEPAGATASRCGGRGGPVARYGLRRKSAT
jgi:hypothetical protein